MTLLMVWLHFYGSDLLVHNNLIVRCTELNTFPEIVYFYTIIHQGNSLAFMLKRCAASCKRIRIRQEWKWKICLTLQPCCKWDDSCVAHLYQNYKNKSCLVYMQKRFGLGHTHTMLISKGDVKY